MKTKLPEKLITKKDVSNFIRDLHENDEFFHCDDRAEDIYVLSTGERLFTADEATRINTLMEQAFAICNVWELPIIRKILNHIFKELNKINSYDSTNFRERKQDPTATQRTERSVKRLGKRDSILE